MSNFKTSPFRSKKPAWSAAMTAGVTILLIAIIVFTYAIPVKGTGEQANILIWPIRIQDWWQTPAFANHLVERISLAMFATICAMVAAYRRTRLLTAFEPVEKTYFESDAQLYMGSNARVKLREYFSRKAGAASGGLWIAPHIQMPAVLETDNIFINGNQNSGKSTIFRALVEQKIASGAHVFLHCFKGELSSAFGATDAVLIAPHVKGSWAWDIANDILNEQDARELAHRLIPGSDNPFWSDAARAVFTDLLVDLMTKRGRNWTWFDLGKSMFTTPEVIKDILAKHEISAAPLLMMSEDGQPTNTTHGVLATLITAVLTTVKSLAVAWQDTPPHRRFSVKAWLTDPNFPHKVVIFQSSARYSELAQLIGRGIIDRVRAFLADSSVPDSATRRIVLALDEMAQLGELDTFDKLIATGRSKGLMVIAATQSIAQIKELYKGRSEIIRQLFRWQIVSSVPQGEPGETLAALLMSKRKVWWMEPNRARDGKGPMKVLKEDERYALTPTQMERDLGVTFDDRGNKVVRALLLGAGDVYLLDYPNTTWLARRKTFAPAEWTKAINPRPSSGSTPSSPQ